MIDAGSSWPICLSADVDDRPVEEDDAGPDDRRDEGPALAGGHARRRLESRSGGARGHVAAVSHRLSAMPGPVALVGAGEFLPAMAEFDAGLLASTGRAPAARRDPADGVVPRRRGRLPALGGDGRRPLRGARRRGRAGPRPRPGRRRRPGRGPGDRRGRPRLPVGRQAGVPRSRSSPAVAGRPGARRRPTSAARSWPAARPGRWSWPATLFDFRAAGSCRGRCAGGRARLRAGRVGRAALRRLAGAAVARSSRSRRRAARSCSGSTRRRRVVGRDGAWQVHGRSRVTVWRGRHRERYRAGDAFRI